MVVDCLAKALVHCADLLSGYPLGLCLFYFCVFSVYQWHITTMGCYELE